MLALLLTFIFLFTGCLEQDLPKETACTHPQILLNKRGKPVRLSFKETQKRITHCEPVKLPGTLDVKGIMHLVVLIDPEGKVHCATPLHSPPFMNQFAIDAVKKWQFKPMEYEGKRVAVYGLVAVRVSWDSSYGKDSCDK